MIRAFTRLLLLLLATPGQASTPQHWPSHATNKCPSGVLYATGYPCEVLDYTWHKYGDKLRLALKTLAEPLEFSEELTAAYMFTGLMYIHHYPRWNENYAAILVTDLTGPIGKKMFYKVVVPVICELAKLVDEVHWGDRLDPINHGTGYLSERFTTIFDGTNIDVSNISKDKELASVMFCGSKYNHCCFKIMIGITCKFVFVSV
jgi:hypothetical protein